MIEKRVSILVAAYNVEKYIEKCIESVVNQTYRNLEIIIVDDCSADNTGAICDRLMQTDQRVRVIHHDSNRRLSAVRNTGLDNASGDYVMFVDGDDWLAEDCVEYLLSLAENTGAEMAISCTNFTTRDMEQTKEDYIEIWDSEKSTANFLYSRIPIGAWNKIYLRSFIEGNHLRFKKLFTAEGFRFISDCSQRINQITVGHRRVYYYRLNNPNSATTLPDIRQGLGALETLNGIERDLMIRTPAVMVSINHHRWANNMYTLRIIIENGSKREHSHIYNECKRYVRKHGWQVAKEAKTKGFSPKILMRSLFPVASCKCDIAKKRKEFSKDVN